MPEEVFPEFELVVLLLVEVGRYAVGVREQLAGLAGVAYGLYLIYLPAAFVVIGAAVFMLAQAIDSGDEQ